MNIERFAGVVERLRDQYAIEGVATAIINHNEIVQTGGFGHALAYPDKLITADSSFSAQSLTKPIFAYLVLGLVAEGKLDLDMPLRHYLDSSYIAHDRRGDKITARQVLSHTCGLPNWRQREIGLQFVYDPGEHFNYSGEGYCYLQMAVEAIVGEAIEMQMPLILSELFMSSSTMQVLPKDHLFRSFFPHLNTNVAFALMTSAADYGRFVQQMLLAEDARIAPMLTPHVSVGKQPLSWGLGWGLMPMGGGKQAFWHWGGGPDARNFALGFPGLGFGLVLLTNSGDARGLAFCRDVIASTLSQLPLPTMTAPFEWLLPADEWRADGE